MPPRLSTAKNRPPSSSASADSSKKRKADSESGSQDEGSLDDNKDEDGGEEDADESNEDGTGEEEQLVEGQGAIGNKRKLVPVRGHQNLTDVQLTSLCFRRLSVRQLSRGSPVI